MRKSAAEKRAQAAAAKAAEAEEKNKDPHSLRK
jgi:hypothetical protein